MTMNLLEVPEGRDAVIRRIESGKALLLRLNELGLFEGSKLTVLRNKQGPVILRIFGSTLALGRGQADKIEVE